MWWTGRRTRVAAVLAAAAVWMAGCDSATAPELEVIYDLIEVDGLPVPATVEDSPGFLRTYVSDEIRLFDDDTWERRQVQQIDAPGGPDQQREWESDGTIRPDGGVLVLDYVCDDTAACVAPDRLRVEGDEAFIEWRLDPDPARVFRYRARGTSD